MKVVLSEPCRHLPVAPRLVYIWSSDKAAKRPLQCAASNKNERGE
jgi:hypothetical protein